MTDGLSQPEADEDPFAEDDEWLAAQVRQLLRAHRSRDAKAVEVVLFYFTHSLTLTLGRHLRKRDPAWDNSYRSDSAYRWFDGLDAEPEYLSPGRLRMCGEVCWVSGQEDWYYDPFDFEMELCPRTGAFRGYVMRFGDSRPLAAKVRSSAVSGVPVGVWSYEFERRRAEQDGVLSSGQFPPP